MSFPPRASSPTSLSISAIFIIDVFNFQCYVGLLAGYKCLHVFCKEIIVLISFSKWLPLMHSKVTNLGVVIFVACYIVECILTLSSFIFIF